MTNKYAKSGLVLATMLAAASLHPAIAADLQTASPVPQPVTLPLSASDASSAFQLKLQYTGEVWDHIGGQRTGFNFMQGVNTSLNVDASKLGWAGARFYFEGFWTGGKSLEYNYASAWNAPSPLDALWAPNVVRLYQAYYNQKFENTDVLFGLYDLQTQFGSARPTEVFLNRSFGMNMALATSGFGVGTNLPSIYPNTALGIRVKQKINDEWTVKFGLLNGLAGSRDKPWLNTIEINSRNGAFGIAEVNYTPIARTKLMAGVWAYTTKLEIWDEFNIDGSRRQVYGTKGGYLGASTRLYTFEGSRGIDGFLNIGFAGSRSNVVDRSLNAGVTITGLFESRPDDKLGLGVDIVRKSPDFRNFWAMVGGNTATYETAFEATYRANVTDWLVIQPDVQYIIDPAADPRVKKNSLIFGVHFELNKLFTF